MRYLLDTCGLLWWTLDPEQLSKATIKKIDNTDLLLNSISVWEIGLKIKNKRLDIGMSIETYTKKLHELNSLSIIPIDENIWIKSLSLDWKHKDPADRLIVATAMLNNCPIVTSDSVINSFYKKTIC